MNLIPAFQKDQDLIRDMEAHWRDREHCCLWWLGQSGFLVQYRGVRLLIDPYLSDSLTRKYAATDKPHVRMSERVVAPELLRHIHLVTSSHNHTDHLDAETLQPVLRNNPGIRFVVPEANRAFVAERSGCPADFPIGLNDRPTNVPAFVAFDVESATGDPLRITMHGIPAKHNEIDRDASGNCRYMGFVFEVGPYRIYHSGDTLLFEGMAELLRPFRLDVALLPINGNDPARRVAGNLDAQEAAQLGFDIGAGCVVPCHYEMFEFNTADVSAFVRAAEQIGQPYRVLRHGEKMVL